MLVLWGYFFGVDWDESGRVGIDGVDKYYGCIVKKGEISGFEGVCVYELDLGEDIFDWESSSWRRMEGFVKLISEFDDDLGDRFWFGVFFLFEFFVEFGDDNVMNIFYIWKGGYLNFSEMVV